MAEISRLPPREWFARRGKRKVTYDHAALKEHGFIQLVLADTGEALVPLREAKIITLAGDAARIEAAFFLEEPYVETVEEDTCGVTWYAARVAPHSALVRALGCRGVTDVMLTRGEAAREREDRQDERQEADDGKA